MSPLKNFKKILFMSPLPCFPLIPPIFSIRFLTFVDKPHWEPKFLSNTSNRAQIRFAMRCLLASQVDMLDRMAGWSA